MTTAEALVGTIAAAAGPRDFPARIGTTAAALARTADARFVKNSGDEETLGICRTLAESREARIDGSEQGLNDADAQVIAFFLAESSATTEFTCVEGAPLRRAVGDDSEGWLTWGTIDGG